VASHAAVTKLVEIGMVSNGVSITDPDDGCVLDVVGFDTAARSVSADVVTRTWSAGWLLADPRYEVPVYPESEGAESTHGTPNAPSPRRSMMVSARSRANARRCRWLGACPAQAVPRPSNRGRMLTPPTNIPKLPIRILLEIDSLVCDYGAIELSTVATSAVSGCASRFPHS